MGGNVVDLGGGNRIEFDWGAFNEIRCSGEMQSALAEVAGGIVARTGSSEFGYTISTKSTRAIALVSNTSEQGAIEEATEKALTKAVR